MRQGDAGSPDAEAVVQWSQRVVPKMAEESAPELTRDDGGDGRSVVMEEVESGAMAARRRDGDSYPTSIATCSIRHRFIPDRA